MARRSRLRPAAVLSLAGVLGLAGAVLGLAAAVLDAPIAVAGALQVPSSEESASDTQWLRLYYERNRARSAVGDSPSLRLTKHISTWAEPIC